MAQNIYDNPQFFKGYSRLNRSVNGLDGAPEWPALKALVPVLSGLRVVDFGCGFGWFCRWAREQGAERILGLDLSERMIAVAREKTSDPAIDYRITDLERLDLPLQSFDFAYSSLALHYIEDFRKLAATVYRALSPGAMFVFSIEHPIYMASSEPGWQTDKSGRKVWPVDGYSVEGLRTTDWLAKGVAKWHRTIGTTLTTLIETGFSIRHVQEWSPTRDQIEAQPDLAEEVERPMLLLVAVQR